jgi:hypothetical protein
VADWVPSDVDSDTDLIELHRLAGHAASSAPCRLERPSSGVDVLDVTRFEGEWHMVERERGGIVTSHSGKTVKGWHVQTETNEPPLLHFLLTVFPHVGVPLALHHPLSRIPLHFRSLLDFALASRYRDLRHSMLNSVRPAADQWHYGVACGIQSAGEFRSVLSCAMPGLSFILAGGIYCALRASFFRGISF